MSNLVILLYCMYEYGGTVLFAYSTFVLARYFCRKYHRREPGCFWCRTEYSKNGYRALTVDLDYGHEPDQIPAVRLPAPTGEEGSTVRYTAS